MRSGAISQNLLANAMSILGSVLRNMYIIAMPDPWCNLVTESPSDHIDSSLASPRWSWTHLTNVKDCQNALGEEDVAGPNLASITLTSRGYFPKRWYSTPNSFFGWFLSVSVHMSFSNQMIWGIILSSNTEIRTRFLSVRIPLFFHFAGDYFWPPPNQRCEMFQLVLGSSMWAYIRNIFPEIAGKWRSQR